MLKSIYGKLGLASLLVLGFQLLFLSTALHLMFNKASLPAVAMNVIIVAVSTATFFGFAVFILFSRRLIWLAKAIEDFRRSNFSEPVSMTFSDENGDEISRLGFAIEQLQKKLNSQMLLSQQIESQRREVFANISHDLRTPLTSMRGYLETLLLKAGTLPAKQQRAYLEVALKQAVSLSKLINDLFDLTKLESNNTMANLETFPLSELVQDLLQKFELIAQEKGVKIETNHMVGHFSTYADIGLIDRALTNLIENSLRHCSSGATIRLLLAEKDNRIHIQVSDTGCGIADNKLPFIFNRMFQTNEGATVGCHNGAGLGLAITKRIVDLHGGTIRVGSKVGIGTSFHFDLPAGLRPSITASPQHKSASIDDEISTTEIFQFMTA